MPSPLEIAVAALEKIADEAPHRAGYCQTDIEYAPTLSDTEMQMVARDALEAIQKEKTMK